MKRAGKGKALVGFRRHGLLIVLICYCFMLTKVIGQSITRGPYLQQPTREGITIRWRTDVPTDTRLEYSALGTSLVVAKTESILTTEHEITLTGLPSDSKYFYGIGTTQKILAQGANYHFTTAPPADTKRPIRFWAMGDFGASNTAKYANNQREVRDQFLAQKNGPVDLWVWMGDNAYCCGTQDEYQTQVFDFYGSTIMGSMPILPSPGNHEYYATSTAKVDRIIPYFDMFTMPTNGQAGGIPSGNEAYYSVNHGPVHFTALDTYGYDEGKYPLADTRSLQYKWLEKDLAANTSLWTVVFFHHPPYTKRSHDSDFEKELTVIRETLVPLFDKYKVDLVLSGHSHVYERSYLMKGHTGLSPTFSKSQHVVQDTKASYTKDSKPIINKEEGTVYMVIGSAGRLDSQNYTDGHPSSVYANYDMGGSSLFTVDENRLDSRWICADGEVRDSFTMFKNVNIRTEKRLQFGESVTLSASWKGNYRWSTGAMNQRSITVNPRRDTLITVSDSLGYLKDSFLLSVAPAPTIKVIVDTTTALCAGQAATVSFASTTFSFDQWTFRVELSDSNGQFTSPTLLAEGKQTLFRVNLPANLTAGSNYRIRVVPDAGFFVVVPSYAFRVSRPAEARLTNESPAAYANEISLNVLVKGTLPARIKITTLPEQTINQMDYTVVVNPQQASVFKIEQLTNVCGVGSIDSRTVQITPPLATSSTTIGVKVYPNPGNDRIVIEYPLASGASVQVVITDLNGKRVAEHIFSTREKQEVDIRSLPAGTYLVEIRSEGQSITKRIVKY
jgi:3',5'-cyclic AMP phosphodiesterase CpdA